MADTFCGCNFKRDPASCPNPAARQPHPDVAAAVDVGRCLALHGKIAGIHGSGGGGSSSGCRSASGVAAGVLLSINETHPRAEILRPLRLRAHRGDWDHLPEQYARLRGLGFTTVQSLLPDLWVQNITGENSFTSLVAGRCAAVPGCWPGDRGNWRPWERWVADIVASSPEGIEFDIWNEPGTSAGYFWNRNFSQYLAMWSHAVTAARRVRPSVRVVGPSTSSFNLGFLRTFLTSANATHTLPNVLSWHEFSADGKDIPGNVAAARRLLAEFDALESSARHPSGTQISINEMVPAGSNFNPAVHISYFANLERAAVASACHSCWASPCPPGAVPDAFSRQCYNCGQHDAKGVHGSMSLDGMLTSDGAELPRSVWWAYKAYGAINGTLLVVNASRSFDGVAALSADGRSISAVVGRISSGGPAGGGSCGPASGVRDNSSTVLRLQGAPVAITGASTVKAAVAHIPDSGSTPLLSPTVTTHNLRVLSDGAIAVPLELALGDAALVIVGADAEVRAKAFATPPLARGGVRDAVPATAAAAAAAAAAATAPTLSSGGVVVQLDAHLPRPVRLTFRGADLSPPSPSGVPPPPSPAPSTQWWRDVKGQQLIPADGSGCTLPHCRTLELPKGTPNPRGVTRCAANCSATGTCAGWSMIRVTPTSGQRDKGPLCMFYDAEGLRKTPPFYHADDNFECGTKKQLQRTPPPSSQPSNDGHLPRSRPCISVIAVNGSATRCCSDDGSSLEYSATLQSSTNWTLQLCSNTLNVHISGGISVGASDAPSGASELRWQVYSVRSSSIEVRALDVEFALIGHRGGSSYMTHQHKTWCPPGTGCEEWGGAAVTCAIGGTCSRDTRERQLPQAPTGRVQWQPPHPLPPAFEALLKPGRSAFIGAADGKVGYSGFSSQPTLPFQAFGAHAAANQEYGAGAGRLQINLRVSLVPP
jgi:hypothetical protein